MSPWHHPHLLAKSNMYIFTIAPWPWYQWQIFQYLLNWHCLHIYQNLHTLPNNLNSSKAENPDEHTQPWTTLKFEAREVCGGSSHSRTDLQGSWQRSSPPFSTSLCSRSQPPHGDHDHLKWFAWLVFLTPFNLQQVQRWYYLSNMTTVNMKIPQKLWILGLYTSVCNWIVSFLTDHKCFWWPMTVRPSGFPSGNVGEEVTTPFLWSEVEGVVFFQLLGVHVSKDLCWTTHTTAALKTAN